MNAGFLGGKAAQAFEGERFSGTSVRLYAQVQAGSREPQMGPC